MIEPFPRPAPAHSPGADREESKDSRGPPGGGFEKSRLSRFGFEESRLSRNEKADESDRASADAVNKAVCREALPAQTLSSRHNQREKDCEQVSVWSFNREACKLRRPVFARHLGKVSRADVIRRQGTYRQADQRRCMSDRQSEQKRDSSNDHEIKQAHDQQHNRIRPGEE